MMLATVALLPLLAPQIAIDKTVESPGQMYVVDKGRRTIMPLEGTSVVADVAGMGARVTVKQTFVNPSATPIEALYTFPLPHDAAVDGMRIRIGNRTIEGNVMRREAAKAVYEAAKANGNAAALLDQQTDNVFTQSVANIAPGRRIEVEITYVQILKFEEGQFEFSYPMVVGPRYLGEGTKDPERLRTRTLPPGVRSGANVDLTVNLRAGAPILDMESVLHEVRTNRTSPVNAQITLARKDEIPNRDFILHFRTAANDVKESLFTTWDEKTGGHFALVLAPPKDVPDSIRSAKEAIFVIDQSGSQSGFPIEKSKEISLALLNTLGPLDTFNVMGFSNEVDPLWSSARPNTKGNVQEAQAFIRSLNATGGTELEKAVVASLAPAPDPQRLRVVLFNTDGYAGQEGVILSNIQRFRGTSRMFTFGVGNSVNRALIDAMSLEGRGASEIVTLGEEAEAARDRFAKRLECPLLVNIGATFDGGGVTAVTPAHLPDVFSARPVVVYGRYTQPGRTKLTLTGTSGGRPWRRVVEVDLPRSAGDGSSVASLWARARIAELKSEGYAQIRTAKGKPASEEAIAQLALDYRIMSEFTSFVAVDRVVSADGKTVQTVQVPLDMPDGVTMRDASGTRLKSSGGFGGGPGLSMAGTLIAPLPVAPSSVVNGNRITRGGLSDKGSTVGPFVAYDPATGSLIDGDTPKAKGLPLIVKALLAQKGTVDVRVTVADISEANLALLRKAGLKVGTHDGATQVIGSTTAAGLRSIAKLPFVRRIAPLRLDRAGL